MKQIELSGKDSLINSLHVKVCDYETGKMKDVPFYDEDGKLARDVEEGGFAVTLDKDELAQSIAYLREDTDGKVGANDILKSMFKYSPDILGDNEPFLMGMTILKELVKRTENGRSENLALRCALANLEEIYNNISRKLRNL